MGLKNAASQPLLCLEEIAVDFSAYPACLHLHLAYEKRPCSLSASSLVEGLSLISQHIQKALSYSIRSTQLLSLVQGLRHTLCLRFEKAFEQDQCGLLAWLRCCCGILRTLGANCTWPLKLVNATSQPYLWPEGFAVSLTAYLKGIVTCFCAYIDTCCIDCVHVLQGGPD